MRISLERKTMDMEARDINYILPAYIRQYLFASKNEDPVEIVFPMYPAAPHPTKPGVLIPIKWVSPVDGIAVEIANDGSNILEVTKEKEAELDKTDEAATEIKKMAEQNIIKEPPAKKAKTKKQQQNPSDRLPKMPPGGDIGVGHADNIGSRDVKLDRQIRSDLKDEPGVDESKEIPADIEKQQ